MRFENDALQLKRDVTYAHRYQYMVTANYGFGSLSLYQELPLQNSRFA
jgi:hypothetical protein